MFTVTVLSLPLMEGLTYCVSYLQYIGQLQIFVSVLNTHPIDNEIILNLYLKNSS